MTACRAALLQMMSTEPNSMENVPHHPEHCAPGLSPEMRKRFVKPESAAQDPRGDVWVSDSKACTLSRIAPDGTTR